MNEAKLVDGWIDVHAHFYPPETPQVRERRLRMMREGAWQVDEPPTWSVEPVLAYMDRTGIQMQMLSNIPKTLDALRASNDFAASVAREYPARFGFLAALPTDDTSAALAEIERASTELDADGFAVTCRYNETYLSDTKLDPVWAELDRRGATVFAHPDAYAPASLGRPSAVIEVAFETARTFTDMLYAGTFRRFPSVKFVVAHCGGALPALSGRLMILGNETWVPNPNAVSQAEMRAHLQSLHLDTAATCPTNLAAALAMTSPERIVYGSDCGVPCTTNATMNANLQALLSYPGLTAQQIDEIGRRAFDLFPKAARRVAGFAAIS